MKVIKLSPFGRERLKAFLEKLHPSLRPRELGAEVDKAERLIIDGAYGSYYFDKDNDTLALTEEFFIWG